MSKLTELLNLIPLAVKNREAILDGIVSNVKLNLGELPEDIKEEILRRRVICFACPFNSENAKTSREYTELTGKNYKSDLEYSHCALCSCSIDFKTANLDAECGAASFNEKKKGKQLAEIKWTKYNKNQ